MEWIQLELFRYRSAGNPGISMFLVFAYWPKRANIKPAVCYICICLFDVYILLKILNWILRQEYAKHILSAE